MHHYVYLTTNSMYPASFSSNSSVVFIYFYSNPMFICQNLLKGYLIKGVPIATNYAFAVYPVRVLFYLGRYATSWKNILFFLSPAQLDPHPSGNSTTIKQRIIFHIFNYQDEVICINILSFTILCTILFENQYSTLK